MNMQIPRAAINYNESGVGGEVNDAQVYAARLDTYAKNLTQLPKYVDASWWGKLGLQKEAILHPLYSTNLPANLLKPLSGHVSHALQHEISAIERQIGTERVADHAKNALPPTPLRVHSLRLQCAQLLLAKAQTNGATALPKLNAFTGVKGRIGALPLEDAMRFLRMRSLAFRRAALRLCIDRVSRERFYQWLERRMVDQLMALPGTPKLDLLERLFDMPTLSQINAEALEWEGLCLLERDGLWDATGPFVHLRLRFPATRAPLPWIKGTIGHDGQIVQHFDPDGGAAVLKLLPPVVPASDALVSNEPVLNV